MLQPGNSKLGNIHTFSLPPCITCPGETEVCAANCYGKKGHFRRSNVKSSHAANHKAVKKDNFVSKMVDEIQRKNVKTLRIHVTGDFFDAPYIRKWIAVAEQCPDVTFYAYTRSWRIKRLMPALTDFNALPNTKLWWSVDEDTHEIDGKPPTLKGVRSAYMQTSDDEVVPAYCDMVLRTKRATLVRFTSGRLVCPGENGMTYKRKMTCERCRICQTDKKVPRKARTRKKVNA